MKKHPNFLVIGAMKAGTTAFHKYLDQHSEIYMTKKEKEPRYFALSTDKQQYTGPQDPAAKCEFKTFDKYQTLFDEVTDEKAIGESSTIYLSHAQAPKNIHDFNPDMKLVVILRDPVDRAFSNFTYTRRDERESANTIWEAMDAEPKRTADGWGPLWHYQRKGLYFEHLSRYFELFPREQMHIILYDDYKKNPQQTLTDTFAFLGVDTSFTVDFSEKHNVSGVPKNRVVNKFIHNKTIKQVTRTLVPLSIRSSVKKAINSANLKKAEPLTKADETRLYTYFKEDVEQLEQLIGKDLTAWKR